MQLGLKKWSGCWLFETKSVFYRLEMKFESIIRHLSSYVKSFDIFGRTSCCSFNFPNTVLMAFGIYAFMPIMCSWLISLNFSMTLLNPNHKCTLDVRVMMWYFIIVRLLIRNWHERNWYDDELDWCRIRINFVMKLFTILVDTTRAGGNTKWWKRKTLTRWWESSQRYFFINSQKEYKTRSTANCWTI